MTKLVWKTLTNIFQHSRYKIDLYATIIKFIWWVKCVFSGYMSLACLESLLELKKYSPWHIDIACLEDINKHISTFKVEIYLYATITKFIWWVKCVFFGYKFGLLEIFNKIKILHQDIFPSPWHIDKDCLEDINYHIFQHLR